MERRLKIQKSAFTTIEEEKNAIANLTKSVNNDFIDAVELIFHSKGRVIVTGIGKSANIGQKIVATFNSTGTPASFMHAADAIHGDLGIIQRDDVVICISKSGDTPEITLLLPLIKMLGNKVIGITGNPDSYLAKNSHFTIDVSVPKEACPNNLAPTSSTTAQLVMGDALAVCLLELRGFTSKDFAKFHPGGALGKKLYMTVNDLCSRNEVPIVHPNDNIKKVIIEISEKRLGMTAVIDNKIIVGIITDGDLRRMMQKEEGFMNFTAAKIMSKNPKLIDAGELAIRALEIMQTNHITSLLVTKNEQYMGVIHLHDILREGII
ncbi:MAG: KpsF/GutQ family sugar-phosphate isomerase [Bacteroidales bacterium]|nr:KpsF/GutQ family sugar-phosphate isomerase [Bacteroidales bacterium]